MTTLTPARSSATAFRGRPAGRVIARSEYAPGRTVLLEITRQVTDYGSWKAAFDRHPPEAAGAWFHRIYRSLRDPDELRIVIGFRGVAAAEAFLAHPGSPAGDAQESGHFDHAGPTVEIYEELEATAF